MAPSPTSLSSDQFEQVFPFHWVVDQEMRLVQFGPSLDRICPGIRPGDSVLNHLQLIRPAQEFTYLSMISNPASLLLLRATASGMLLRGQALKQDACAQAVFLGSPWFTDPAAVTEAGLRFDDFAIHDPVMDLLQVVQSERIATADVKQLAKKLESQKQILADQNEELIRSEARLHEQQEEVRKLALVASRTQDAVVITDAGGYVEWVNEGFTRMTGYTLEEVVGLKPGPLLQGADTDPEVVASMHEKRIRGEGFHSEIINYTKSGRPYWLAIEVQPVVGQQGELTNFIAIERDITQAKRDAQDLMDAKDAAERANRIKSEFLANMSHEIRTPLNAVIGLASLLEHSALSDKQEEHVRRIRYAGNALLNLLSEILDFSKIEAGQLILNPVRFEPASLIKECVSTFALQAEAKGLRFECEVSPELTGVFTGDAGRIRQVLLNFLGNALKFTGRGEIRSRLMPDPDRPGQLLFSVEDTGVGIPAVMHEKIFEAFQQADSSTTRQHGGTGLGLAISRRLVHLMGGDIGVESREGEGSRFWFTVPLLPIQESDASLAAYAPSGMADRKVAEPSSRPTADVAPQDLTGLRVLVVEDTQINRELAVEMLVRLGCRAEVATNGVEALEQIRENEFDLVLMDCQMPGMDGYEATHELRRMERDGELGTGRGPLHIVAMTAHAMRGDREKCLGAGMDDYLSKPARLEDVQAALDRWREGVISTEPAHEHSEATCSCQETLDQLCRELDTDSVIELVQSFLRDLGPMSDALLARGAAADLAGIRAQAHALKGIAASLGLTHLAHLTASLERQAEDADDAGIATGLAQLEAECERARNHLQQFLG